MYCGQVSDLPEVSTGLFIAADRYQYDALKAHCELHLIKRLTPTNAVDMYVLGDTYGGSVITDKAWHTIKK